MQSYLSEHYSYNLTANSRTIQSVLAATDRPESVDKLLSHILVAHSIWLLRIAQPDLAKNSSPWATLNPESFEKVNRQLFDDTKKMLDSENLTRELDYVNSKGESYRSSVIDICSHILLHSAYHRGQIAQLLRQTGNEPAITDYIFYTRHQI
ncbi:MAG: hypothetical protein ITG00_09570 [Flavobacterium sp.]|nr:hypothetical protein [Flavobacterium sp.]